MLHRLMSLVALSLCASSLAGCAADVDETTADEQATVVDRVEVDTVTTKNGPPKDFGRN